MIVLDITWPGTRPKMDPDRSFFFSNMLLHLQSDFFEANEALNLYNEACALPERTNHRERFEDEGRRLDQMRIEVEKEFKYKENNRENQAEIYHIATIRVRRQHWETGEKPTDFVRMHTRLYAQFFLFALDNFYKLLKKISEEKDSPEILLRIAAEYIDDFPDLLRVRNSVHHMEDRIRGIKDGRGKNPKMLDLKPIERPGISAPSGKLLVLSTQIGKDFSSTKVDGELGSVNVSIESLNLVKKALLNSINSFSWSGPKQHWPQM